MKTANNWIFTKDLSLNDKIKELLKVHYRLVLVQVHELERLRTHKRKDQFANYVNNLYEHYIINNLPKTYLIS